MPGDAPAIKHEGEWRQGRPGQRPSVQKAQRLPEEAAGRVN
jgi:hypothetical protein